MNDHDCCEQAAKKRADEFQRELQKQPVPSGNQDEREPLSAILAKCEQYWNEPNICDAEIHAVLEFIHQRARESVSLLYAERKRVQELEGALRKCGELANDANQCNVQEILNDIIADAEALLSKEQI